eukprot:scaffold967_cov173-Ochromonas_danica.AAC.48
MELRKSIQTMLDQQRLDDDRPLGGDNLVIWQSGALGGGSLYNTNNTHIENILAHSQRYDYVMVIQECLIVNIAAMLLHEDSCSVGLMSATSYNKRWSSHGNVIATANRSRLACRTYEVDLSTYQSIL